MADRRDPLVVEGTPHDGVDGTPPGDAVCRERKNCPWTFARLCEPTAPDQYSPRSSREQSPVFARLYDVVMYVADRLGVARRRKALVQRARGLIVEIGAGTGLEFPHYAAGSSVIAVEPDAEMIERARARCADSPAAISLVIADARALPFRDGVFDAAVSVLAFCTIPQPEKAAAEMRRVLNSAGVAHLLEHVRAIHRPLAWAQVLLTPIWSRVAGGCHLDRRTAESMRDAGFDVTVQHTALDGTIVELTARPTHA